MVVEKGYKQTEVGVIPADWEVISTIQIALNTKHSIKIGPFGSALKKELLVKYGYKVYGQENVFEESIEIGDRFINNEHFKKLKSCELLPGDFVVSMMGTVGYCMIMPEEMQAGIMDSHLLRIKIETNKINPTYFKHVFSSFLTLNQIKKLSVGGIMEGLSSKIIKQLQFITPPLPEQTAIATALSDMDALIAQTEKLIEKKKAIKQGVMQELLRPKEGWVTKKLGEVCDLRNGYAFKSANYNQGGEYLIVTISNVQDGYLDSSGFNKIAALPTDIQDSQILKVGELLVSLTGNVGRICTVSLSNCLLNQRVGKLIPKNIDSGFLFYYLLNSTFRNIMIQNAVGGAQGNIGKGTVLDYELTFPNDLVEQKSIFEISSNIQLEIEKLEQKLEKLKLKKQGMMQALLTGKIRLV